MQTHLWSSWYWRGEHPYKGKFMSPLQRELYALILGGMGDGGELFWCLLFLSCLQLYIILMLDGIFWGGVF